MRHIETGDALVQLTVVPETRYRYVFPILADLPPSLNHRQNPYIHSILYEKTFGERTAGDPLAADHTSPEARTQQVYTTPYHAAKLVDSNISSVKAARWTSVTADDSLVQSLLEIYFIHEYPLLGPFHKDLLLQDMISGRERYCSSLLVNAILASACVR